MTYDFLVATAFKSEFRAKIWMVTVPSYLDHNPPPPGTGARCTSTVQTNTFPKRNPIFLGKWFAWTFFKIQLF